MIQLNIVQSSNSWETGYICWI